MFERNYMLRKMSVKQDQHRYFNYNGTMHNQIPPSPLEPTQITPALATRWLARPYQFHPSLPSTNDLLRTQAQRGQARHGAVILTDYQSRGRGRLQRTWEAPPGTSLLFSALFTPDWPAQQAQWLTMLASVAIAHTVAAETGLTTGIKWPNDLMLRHNGRWHKFCGLLLDGVFGGNGRLQQAVLGMGINVNIPAEALPPAPTPAISLAVALGQPVPRDALLLALLPALEAGYDRAAAGQSPQPAWADRLITLGQPVTVTRADGSRINGIAEQTTEWGELVVVAENGRRHTIAAGDVTLRPN